MRITLSLLLCLLPCTALAQTLSPALPFVSLEATNKSSAAAYQDKWRDGYGGYDTSFYTAKSVESSVRNLSRETQDLSISCVFFGMQPTTNARTIFGTFAKDFTLLPSRDLSIIIDSPTAHGRDANYSLLGSRYLTGTRYEGWLVQLRLKKDGRIIKQVGSRAIFEELAGKPEFAQMQKAYQDKLK